jgi:tungstate transport system ATP-binding protein
MTAALSSLRTEAADPAILPLDLSHVDYVAGGQRLIDDLSMAIGRGGPTVILGPNGAGKSLLLRLCHGLLKATSGTIMWNSKVGRDVQRSQAMVFQRPVMLRRSAAANIAYALRIHRVPRREHFDRVADALAMTGLSRLAGRPARVLSVGEQQRLAFARAWALRPQVLFLDEPTASLDPAAAQAIEEIIRHISGGETKVVLATQDLAQARRLGEQIVFLSRGKVVEQTPASNFFTQPATTQAVAFLNGEAIQEL